MARYLMVAGHFAFSGSDSSPLVAEAACLSLRALAHDLH